MKKFILIIMFSTFSFTSSAKASDMTILQADSDYILKNDAKLAKLYKSYNNEMIINYLYSKAMLNKGNPFYAQSLVKLNYNGFMRNDLIHQLLSFYFKKDDFYNYKKYFNQLPLAQATLNEKCGYDLANILTLTKKPRHTNDEWLVNNNIPERCVDLVVEQYKLKKINNNQLKLMFVNLLIQNKKKLFTEVACELKINPNDPKYKMISQVASTARKDPVKALEMLKKSKLDSINKNYLTAYIAMQFSLKQKFAMASSLYNKFKVSDLSDDEFEWKARTFLYFSNWKRFIATIDSMPQKLKDKSQWIYWKAIAYKSLGQQETAKQLFKQIPKNYSYYSMLAQSQLDENTIFLKNPPSNTDLSIDELAKDALYAFNLYKLGKINNSKNLTNIANAEWNYVARQSNDQQLLAMSNLAFKHKFYDIGIYAATQMMHYYISLSFPIVFSDIYNKYCKSLGLDISYTLAVTRQESRFNYSVVAWDGGIGLMQLMPQTALYISRKTGYNDCVRENLECNIKFGTWYLANAFNKFNKNLIYASAAYNAGPNRAKRWQDSLGKLDKTIQIELIPFSITRDYVQKIILNKAVYDAQLSGNSQINLLKYINNLNNNHYLNEFDDDNTDANKL